MPVKAGVVKDERFGGERRRGSRGSRGRSSVRSSVTGEKIVAGRQTGNGRQVVTSSSGGGRGGWGVGDR